MAAAPEWSRSAPGDGLSALVCEASPEEASDTIVDLEPMTFEAANRIVAERVNRDAVLPPPLIGPAPMIGQYALGARLGRSLDSELVAAVERSPGRSVRPCLIKRLLDDQTQGEVIRDWQMNLGLRHRHIVRVQDCGTLDGRLCSSRELIDGASVYKLLQAGLRKRLSGPSIVCLGWQLADALAHAHGHAPGVVHGSICPSEILVAFDGTAKLTEMSLSTSGPRRLRLARAAQPWRLDYMAPQQRDGHGDEASADIYGLGMVLAELITGLRPAVGREQDVHDALRQAALDRQDVPRSFIAVVMRMVALTAEHRPATAKMIAEKLMEIGWSIGERTRIERRLRDELAMAVTAQRQPSARTSKISIVAGKPLSETAPARRGSLPQRQATAVFAAPQRLQARASGPSFAPNAHPARSPRHTTSVCVPVQPRALTAPCRGRTTTLPSLGVRCATTTPPATVRQRSSGANANARSLLGHAGVPTIRPAPTTRAPSLHDDQMRELTLLTKQMQLQRERKRLGWGYIVLIAISAAVQVAWWLAS